MVKRVISEPTPEASKPDGPGLLRYRPVDWGKISAYLAIVIFVGGVLWKFAYVYISVMNLRDDMKELRRESENLLRTSVETSVRVTVLERSNAQQQHAMPSSCPTQEPKGPGTNISDASP